MHARLHSSWDLARSSNEDIATRLNGQKPDEISIMQSSPASRSWGSGFLLGQQNTCHADFPCIITKTTLGQAACC